NRTNPQKYFVGIFVGYPCSCVGVNYLETKPDFLRFESASGHHFFLTIPLPGALRQTPIGGMLPQANRGANRHAGSI
ncbi:hypothetical protein, partial [Mesorhizobium sp. M4A.F.Ca.ET.090.04.2.1]|uniref:hypothetical protein n=1 Tax=Mesorhizobium sp. M4A.F.Ca.ET.090.04.2.1 TaxID=2496663 RepID=UPI001AEC740D